MTPRAYRLLSIVAIVASSAVALRAEVKVDTTSVPVSTVAQPYSTALSASGGQKPYSWSVSAGSLPSGLSLSAAGILTGTPASAGTFGFTVKVTDSGSGKTVGTDTQALSMVVAPALAISTSSLPGGQVGVVYSQTLQASGGTAPYTFSISAGALPGGLSLSGAQIGGSPTNVGGSNFTVKVVDANSASVTRALAINIAAAPLNITTVSLPSGQVGGPYSQVLQATGGTGVYTWSISAGALPSGLSLSASGQITGTPSAAGIFTFTSRVVDTTSAFTTRALTIAIAAVPVSITTSSLPSGQVGLAYSQSLQASGGTAPYTWSTTSGTLPGGLLLSAGGLILGTPNLATTASFSVHAVDSLGANATISLSLTIVAGLAISGCPVATATAGQAYNATLSATGGTAPYTWTLTGGQLPGGLSMTVLGVLSGTPSSPGAFNFGIKVVDNASASTTSNCTITVNTAVSAPTITTASFPAGVSGAPYSQALSAAGGQPPYSWALAAGTLPAGLTLSSSGQISGTPTAAGTSSFTVRVSDSAARTAAKDFTIGIGAGLAIVTSSLAPIRTGVVAAQQLSASGGNPPYVWTVSAGVLPPGLTLSASGSLGGTPTQAGSYGFSVRVRDSTSASVERAFTLIVTASLTIGACPAAIATQGQSYASTLLAAGGQTPYTWTLASGTIPPGVVLNSSTSGLSGVPADPGIFLFTVLITDHAGATATKDCQVAVASGLTIKSALLPDASLSSAYLQNLLAAGGKPPYSWALSSGNLPLGLTLDAGGTISGLPAVPGSFSFVVSVADTAGAMAQQALSINVIQGLIVAGCSATGAEVGLSYSSSVLGSGGVPPYAWSLADGSLPAGLVLDRLSGAISGKPTQSGLGQFSVLATDVTNRTASRSCSINVSASLTISTSSFNPANTGASYSDTVSLAGGVPPFVWSTTAGSLPPGLSLNASTGHITGTPLVVGSFAFTARIIDGLGGQATKDLSIAVSQGLVIPDCPNPAAIVGQPYSAFLIAVGGTLPFQWRVDSGALPAGIVFSSQNAAITGTPAQPGLSTYVLRVDDANSKSTTRLCSIQVNSPGLSITSSPALPNAVIGKAYSQTFTVAGGRAPYSWSIASSGGPAGFSLSSTEGIFAGTAGSAGAYSFTVQVTDQDNNVARQIVTLTILAGTPPNVTITGVPDIVDPGQQPVFNLQLDSGYPAAINGTITLVFTPDPAVGVDDPAVQFATGGRAMTFTVPAGSTQLGWSAPVVAFQSGTVSGTIQLNVSLASNGTDITPAGSSKTIRVDRLAPRIVNASIVQTTSGFEVHVTGFSTTREVTAGTFRFTTTAGSSAEIPVPLDNTSKTWFQSAASDRFGGQFGLVQSFQWQPGQPVDSLVSVSISLTNAQGTSQAVQAKF